jgi:hypothetical protein
MTRAKFSHMEKNKAIKSAELLGLTLVIEFYDKDAQNHDYMAKKLIKYLGTQGHKNLVWKII